MRLVIERIDVVGPDRRARRLVFTDTDDSRTTAAAVVRTLGLEPGDTVDIAAIDEAERPLANDRALGYLSYRDRSAREVLDRLTGDGYPPELAQVTVSRLEDLALIDDERFAHTWARSRARAGFGSRRIAHELRERAVAEELAHAAVTEACGDPLTSAREALHGKTASTHAERERLMRKLVQRGFDFAVAREAVAPPQDSRDEEPPFVRE